MVRIITIMVTSTVNDGADEEESLDDAASSQKCMGLEDEDTNIRRLK
jgi:hypothetical protein